MKYLKQPLSKTINQHAINLIIPLGLFIFLAILYLYAIPSGESPDESGHVQCIEQVAQDGNLPTVDPKPIGRYWSRSYAMSGFICYHMPLYYLAVGYAQMGVHAVWETPRHYEFPPTNPDGPKPNMFFHDEKETLFFLEEPGSMIFSRILSILLWGTMIVTTYGIVLRIAPEHAAFAIIAATILAGWPQFVFMSRAINNDALAIPLTAVVLWILLDIGKPQRLPFVSLFASFALLTKLTTLFIFILLIIYLPIEIWSSKENRAAYKKPTFISALILGSTLLLITLHPLLNKHAQLTMNLTNGISEKVFEWQYWQDVWKLTLSSGWVRFGMMNVAAPQWQANLWWALIAICGGAGIVWSIKQTQTNARMKHKLIIMSLWAGAIIASYLRINLNRYQPQFRYMFFLLPIVVAFTGIGFIQLTQANRWGARRIAVFLAITIAIINVWIVINIVLPAYGI